MAFHIVTDRCFLACEKVISVVLEELAPEVQKKKVRKSKSKKKVKALLQKAKVMVAQAQFCIAIGYYPLSISQQANNSFGGGRDQENTLEIRIKDKKEAVKLYKEIIKEVQEQHPNEAYLDKLVHELLGNEDTLMELDNGTDR